MSEKRKRSDESAGILTQFWLFSSIHFFFWSILSLGLKNIDNLKAEHYTVHYIFDACIKHEK